jgi:phosphohistidine phosphatase
MKLYLLQHGDALGKEVNPERPLSQKGKDDIARVADLVKNHVTPNKIVHSGKTRAKQSAEILAKALVPSVSLRAIEGIGPNDSVEAFAREILPSEHNLLVVGHLPFLSSLVAFLTTGSTKAVVDFTPGSLVCLTLRAPDEWTIQWMVRPELIL